MRKMQTRKARSVDQDDLLPEYNIDYRKARPNRFATRFSKESVVVVLDPDIDADRAPPGSGSRPGLRARASTRQKDTWPMNGFQRGEV